MQLNTNDIINQPLFTYSTIATITDQVLVISLVKVKKSKVNYTVLF